MTTIDDFKTVDICYKYDGSFYGMLSCAFESFTQKQIPVQITSGAGSLFNSKYIKTNEQNAQRILQGVRTKIGSLALEYVKHCFLTSMDAKEITLIHFLIEGFKKGKKFIQMLNTGFTPNRSIITSAFENPHLTKMQKGIDLLLNESHKFVQFIRFSDINGALVSIIEPQNYVLPLLAEHFIQRYINEQFLIYDKTHRLGLMYTNYTPRLEYIDQLDMPTANQDELKYRSLWKLFYNTIAISERKNERCRTNFMPKKYWKNITEVS